MSLFILGLTSHTVWLSKILARKSVQKLTIKRNDLALMNQFDEITRHLRNRRSIYPIQYVSKEIQPPLLNDILENANHAPTHRLTQPWRFKVISGQSKERFTDFLVENYKQHTSKAKFNESKPDKIRFKCEKSDKILIICFQRDVKMSVPEWEEIAATAMAVQNIYLSCSAAGIGCYWSTPKAIEYIGEFCDLEEGEKCIGVFYMGYTDPTKSYQKSPRNPISQKVKWL
jgi:nitroreductase